MFEVYYERGKQLSYARKLMDSDKETVSALALVSIHSAIAYNDALLTRLSGKPSRGEDHASAANATEKHCRSKKIDSRGLQHLKQLIGKKTPYSYGDAAVTTEQAQAVSIAATRFEVWVNQVLKGLKELS
jgi:hypothetical protein